MVAVVADREGKARIHPKRLEPVGEPDELAELRALVASMLPRADLCGAGPSGHSNRGYPIAHLGRADSDRSLDKYIRGWKSSTSG